ncbi:envelope glycoprotein G [Ateline alphaherpesvirus 1]|uniref:Envelope glycoprotein G n=1 Tax=Herpesvirus ateles type 1 (strain Lennette) TaxID=35243 RepID=A0A1S6JLS1_HSVA1|nr:envelope glycoprotein G [Ateline alphaherpesvirus 1]AQS79221.1 envelope glycoprotein G [Ateline alphaherpesvirus 1]
MRAARWCLGALLALLVAARASRAGPGRARAGPRAQTAPENHPRPRDPAGTAPPRPRRRGDLAAPPVEEPGAGIGYLSSGDYPVDAPDDQPPGAPSSDYYPELFGDPDDAGAGGRGPGTPPVPADAASSDNAPPPGHVGAGASAPRAPGAEPGDPTRVRGPPEAHHRRPTHCGNGTSSRRRDDPSHPVISPLPFMTANPRALDTIFGVSMCLQGAFGLVLAVLGARVFLVLTRASEEDPSDRYA